MHLGAQTGRHRAPRTPRPTLRSRFLHRRTFATTAVAGAVVTGVAVGVQTVVGSQTDDAGAAAPPVTVNTAAVGEAADRVSRSTLRPAIEDLEKKQQRRTDALENPQAAARRLLEKRGWGDQFSCLDSLWSGESNWDHRATNPSSGAYGIPQSLPAAKMASAGSDWRTNPVTQIRWGLDYIESTYGSPCAAESFKQGNGWY
jgi:hypothetical protein